MKASNDTVLAWLQAKIAQVSGLPESHGEVPALCCSFLPCMHARMGTIFVLAATRQSVPCMQDFNVLRYKKGGMSAVQHACMPACMQT